MRASWEALHAGLDRSVRTLQADQTFQRAKQQHSALAVFHEPKKLVAHRTSNSGDLDEKDRVLGTFVTLVQQHEHHELAGALRGSGSGLGSTPSTGGASATSSTSPTSSSRSSRGSSRLWSNVPPAGRMTRTSEMPCAACASQRHVARMVSGFGAGPLMRVRPRPRDADRASRRGRPAPPRRAFGARGDGDEEWAR